MQNKQSLFHKMTFGLFQKQTYVDKMLSLLYGKGGVFETQSFDSYVRTAFGENVIAHSCIVLRGSAIGSLDWDLFDSRDNEIEEHDLLTLLKKPNPSQSGRLFFQSLQSIKDLAGTVYIYANRGGVDAPKRKTGKAIELQILRSDWMKANLMNGRVVSWEYAIRDEHGRRKEPIVFAPENILKISTFNPLNEFEGSSLIESAWKSICIYNSALNHNKSVLDKGATVSGVLKAPSGLTKQQTEDLHKVVSEQNSGANNAGRTMVLSSGFDWISTETTMKDLDFLSGKNVTAREIALALKVPPLLLNIQGDNTFANYKEARESFWEDTVFIEANIIREGLNSWLCPMFGKGLYLNYDKDSISALEDKRRTKVQALAASTFLTINEKRVALGYEPLKDSRADMLFVDELPLDRL